MTPKHCRSCLRSMRPQKVSPDGVTVLHRSRGLCDTCWRLLGDIDARAEYECLMISRDDLLHDYELLCTEGCSWQQCATRLGMKYTSFERAMQRARAAQDPRAGRIGEVWPPRKAKA